MEITVVDAQDPVKQVSSVLGLTGVEILVDDACIELEIDGMADIKNHRIYLSPEQPDLMETVRHELCHLATKRHGHGKKWKELMRKVGSTSV
jgi:hypothetical protein